MTTSKPTTTTCPSCGATVAQHTGKGRPSVYCSTTCRRSAEAAIRRLQVHLTRCEREEQKARLALAVPGSDWRTTTTTAEAKVQFWQGEVARLTTELRSLLTDADGDSAASPIAMQ